MSRFKLFVALMLTGMAAHAIVLPDIISDNMVLQQNSDVRLWGWSSAGAEVVVTTSWNGAAYTGHADRSGRWSVDVATPSASYDTYTITFADGNGTAAVGNVLVGEVWFCSGQSNMEMPLNGFWTQPVENGNRDIAYSGQYRGKIRMATIEKVGTVEPADSVSGKWKECEPVNARWFSAVGFHFAVSLNRILDVPVGIINCSWGGSHVEGWLPREELELYADVDLSQAGNKDVWEWDQPLIMYNGMLHPLIGYTVKGFLWNQGESNINQHDRYPQRLARMVEIWRNKWGHDDLPFYCVEIPPHDYDDALATNAALLRESQHRAVELIPNSGIVCTSDLSKPYEAADIHPSMKQPIGERLAFMAAVRTYGIEGIVCDSPVFSSMEVEGNSALLHFNNADGGFTPNRNLQGFEVAGADHVFYPAEATEVDRDIRVTCDKVSKIESVRYCFRNWMPGKVYSIDWLPLVPFRTDDWTN